jgi:hypothetical protein
MRECRWGCGIVAVLMGLAGPGCSRDGLVKVQGVVTLDGVPVEGAMVTFLPEGASGRTAHGYTGAGGVFQLATLKPADGAQPGTYKVIVQYQEGVETSPATNMRSVFQEIDKARSQKPRPPRYVIPAKYTDPGQSDLRQTVPPDGEVRLALSSQ